MLKGVKFPFLSFFTFSVKNTQECNIETVEVPRDVETLQSVLSRYYPVKLHLIIETPKKYAGRVIGGGGRFARALAEHPGIRVQIVEAEKKRKRDHPDQTKPMDENVS